MRFIAYLLLALTALTALPGLGERDFWPPDEARYGRIAVEMDESGALAALSLNGESYGDKPPGYFWVARAAAWFHGGLDEWALRLPSVLGALIFVLALGFAAGRATGAHAALLAGLLPLATWSFAHQARTAQLDMLFAGLLTWAVLDGYRALEEGRRGLLLRSGFVLGLAVVVKGPLALMAWPLLGLWALVGRPGRGEERAPLGGAALGMVALTFLPALAWLGLAVWESGFGYVRDELFMRNVVKRATQGLAHLQPWSFYLYRLPPAFAPWLLFLPLLALKSTRELLGTAGRRLAAFSILWFLLFLATQSLFPGKRSIYAFLFHGPLYLLLAQAGAAATNEKGGRWGRSWAGLVLASVALVLVAAGVVLALASVSDGTRTFLFLRAADLGIADLRPRLDELGLVLTGGPRSDALIHALRLAVLPFLGGFVLVAIDLLRRRLDVALDKAALALALAFMVLAAWVVPELDGQRSRRALAFELSRIAGDRPVAILRHLDEGVLYYFGRNMAELKGDEASVPADLERKERMKALAAESERALAAWLEHPGNELVLARRRDQEALPAQVAGRSWAIVFEGRVGSDKDFDLLRFTPAAVGGEERR